VSKCDEPRRDESALHDGYQDGFEPVVSLDLARCGTASELLREMSRTSFGGRQLGEAADVLEAMVRDPECVVIATLSGAMTVAKMGLVLCDMLDHGMVDMVVSTGALMAHGFIEATGGTHFKYRPGMNDLELYKKGYDRVYDTLELEKNLDDAEVIVNAVMREIDPETPVSSFELMERLGAWLTDNAPPESRGILKSAVRNGVPVYVPAFSDSELGLDFALFNRRCVSEGKPTLYFDPMRDLEDYTGRCHRAKRLGIFTIGGGVPRNWAQQVGPYLDIIDKRLGSGGSFKRFHYAVRICPEPVHWGGLSGCTYSEGVSWGKFVSRQEGGRWAEVPADATIAWPLLVRGVLERLGVYGG
jgi:deoxyhypusine synthase